MRITTTRSRSVIASDRLDAHFFTAPGAGVREQILMLEAGGMDVVPIGELGRVWDPPRFARAYAAPLEPGLPYLRPYDVFDYLPTATDRLSISHNEGQENLVPSPGTILQTCSGRNLGPCVMADDLISRFALSHDMIRIEIDRPELRFYLYAFLKTALGQKLLRRSMSGSVIDHLTTSDIQSVPVPMVAESVRNEVATIVERSFVATSNARAMLDELLRDRLRQLPPLPRTGRLCDGWTVHSATLSDRLDVAFHDPLLAVSRKQLIQAGGVRCGDLASATLPVRYKRYYVTRENGRPILSGRQLLQIDPVNLRYVSDRSFKDPTEYEIVAGMSIFGAVGRAEGRQGAPALVTSDRNGWLASNDVMRLRPHPGVMPGAVWLALACPQVRVQINALSFGSVIDHMNPWDVEDLVLPVVDDRSAAKAQTAWELFADAASAQMRAATILEAALNASA